MEIFIGIRISFTSHRSGSRRIITLKAQGVIFLFPNHQRTIIIHNSQRAQGACTSKTLQYSMESRVQSVTENPLESKGRLHGQAAKRWEGKTLFIILDAGTAIRNILRTNVFKCLQNEKWLRIVIFSPITDAEFKREFESENVIVEPVQFWKANSVVKTLRSLRKDFWIRQFELARFKEKRTKKTRLLTSLTAALFLRKATPQKVRDLVDRLQRWENASTPSLGDRYFDEYKPDLVFYATIYSRDLCLEVGAK